MVISVRCYFVSHKESDKDPDFDVERSGAGCPSSSEALVCGVLFSLTSKLDSGLAQHVMSTAQLPSLSCQEGHL